MYSFVQIIHFKIILKAFLLHLIEKAFKYYYTNNNILKKNYLGTIPVPTSIAVQDIIFIFKLLQLLKD